MKLRSLMNIGPVIAIVVACGCAGTGGKTASTVGISSKELVYPGFETYPTPREFDGPGTVFEQDKKGYLRYIGALDISVPPNPPREDLGSVAGFSDMSLGAIARMLEFSKGVDLSASFATKSGAAKSVVLGEGYRLRPTNSIDAKVKKAVADGTLVLKPDTRYWVVRETIQVDKVEFVLADWTASHADFVAKLPQAQVDLGASAQRARGATKTVGRSYPARRNLFYYRDEILPATPGISTGPTSVPRVVEVSVDKKPKASGFIFK